MNQKTRTVVLVVVIAVVLIGAGVFLFRNNQVNAPGSDQVACTQDAMQCPDGSYVGRVSPSCEFAACLTSNSPEAMPLTARIHQGVSGLGIRITPLEVLEDSRCPVDVYCIQAGTVRLRATLQNSLGTSEQIFKLNTPLVTETETIVLTKVLPERHSGSQISPSDYEFIFRATKRTPFSDGKG